MEYDVIIIGAGPSGISASLYTVRANKKTLVLYEDKAGLEKANKIENYYGFENGITGEELYNIGIKQAKNLGVDVKKEEVIKIEMNSDMYSNNDNVNENKNSTSKYRFLVTTSNGLYKAKVVILATGNKKNKPKIKGIEKFEGKGVSYCAICDGFFYRNKDVVVIGSGDYAISETNDLINVVKDVTILTNGEKAPDFRADNVKIETRGIKEIKGDTKVDEVVLDDGTNLKIDGVFVAQGVAGSSDFAKKLGALTNKDNIVVNENMETNVDGLFACGDCTGGLLQVAKAVHEGTVAGLAAIKKC